MFEGVRMRHVGPPCHISPHLVVHMYFMYLADTPKSKFMGQND